MADDHEDSGRAQEAEALAELTLCENLAQTSGWAARWSATETEADGALLWAPDALHPLFLCIAGVGEGSEKALRRSVPSDRGFVAELLEEGEPKTLSSVDLLAASDPFLKAIPRGVETALVVPLQAEGIVVGILAIFFRTAHDTDEALAMLETFSDSAAPALGRALRAERKTVGMLRAIERLTNLFDLSKAFGSTIDLSELSRVIVVKAADFLHAEAASLWLLDGEDVVLEATAVNESYTVDPSPESVGSSVAADVLVGEEVMATVVNASSALIHYDRCAIAVLQRGKLRLGAVSGMAEIDRGDESIKRTEALLEWVFFGGADVAVTQQHDGAILSDRPETEEKFRTFFADSGMRAFFGVLLKDEEGKLGVLGFESEEPILFDQETRDLMQILVNQATVAVRNAQLYQQVPLAGFWKPLLDKRRKLGEVPARRALKWAP